MKQFIVAMILFLLPAVRLMAQDIYVNPQDPAFRAQYDTVQFGDRFSVCVLSDSGHDYYLVDFARLADQFERVYFMNLVFRGDQVVNLDGDLEQDHIWFSAMKGSPVQEINSYFLKLKRKCEQASASFSEHEKTEWMNKNNKYK